MLFSSYEFLLVFFPIVVTLYFIINTQIKDIGYSKYFLIFASLFFYGYWYPPYLVLILISVGCNFYLAHFIHQSKTDQRRNTFFYLGLSLNLGLLGYFKYRNFFLENINEIFSLNIQYFKIALPLGISFFTLQQIAFLVDTKEKITEPKSFQDYVLFVCFFPQLIAGPIVHYQDLIPQFQNLKTKSLNIESIGVGISLFIIGLSKKVLLADTFAIWANEGFQHYHELHFFSAWGTALSYTFQLYFDFSGYSDMAIGIGKIFNIEIPLNFNSPFKARNIIDFWNRWHMTLSQFITTYVFTPLFRSFNKLTFSNSLISVFITMLISGFWHGAGWNFLLYGAMYGLALIVNHMMKKKKIKLPSFLAITITFLFTIFVFTMFRSESIYQGFEIYKAQFGLKSFIFPKGIVSLDLLRTLDISIGPRMNNDQNIQLLFILFGLAISLFFKNSTELTKNFQPSNKLAILLGTLFSLCLLGMNGVNDFIYYNF